MLFASRYLEMSKYFGGFVLGHIESITTIDIESIITTTVTTSENEPFKVSGYRPEDVCTHSV